ncbi:MAG TPA: ABC transporter substrate-binding protein [Stellaceae bacterium]|nr:ABC transporter substrate-binding protein [Stellaceae bacterium]
MRIFGPAAAALVAMLYGVPAANAEPLQIKVGWATITHMQPSIDLLQKRHPELFHHFGKTYVAEGVHYRGSTPQIQALAINELQIAAFGPEAFVLAVRNAHLDVRVVGDVFQDGVSGYRSITYVVRANSPIRKVEDLKGHSVASNAIGSFGDTAMRVMLHKHGIKDSDITTVETSFGNMPAMLDDGKVDLINLLPQYEHFLTDGKYRKLFTAADGEGRIQAQIWAMRADFIAAHRAALIDFFEDHIRAVQWLLNPANHKEAVAIAAELTKAPPQRLDYMYTKNDSYHAPDARPDIPATQKSIDVNVQLGLLKKGLTISPKYIDLSLVNAANKRIASHSGG